MKQKAFFIILKGLPVKQLTQFLWESNFNKRYYFMLN